MIMDLYDIREYCFKLKRGDRHLDCQIWAHFGEMLGIEWNAAGEPISPHEIIMGKTMRESLVLFPGDVLTIARNYNVPKFTISYDAARLLVPEGWRGTVGFGPPHPETEHVAGEAWAILSPPELWGSDKISARLCFSEEIAIIAASMQAWIYLEEIRDQAV